MQNNVLIVLYIFNRRCDYFYWSQFNDISKAQIEMVSMDGHVCRFSWSHCCRIAGPSISSRNSKFLSSHTSSSKINSYLK